MMPTFLSTTVLPGEAGPSNQRRVRSEERAEDIAALSAQMNEVQQGMRDFQSATMERFSVVNQNFDRLDSNIDTQKKYFTQQLKSTQMTADAAFDQGTDNRKSINAILDHAGQTNQFMSKLMDRLASLRFDLPNVLDQWANNRFGDAAGPSTVTASQLHHNSFESSAPSIPIPRLQLPIIQLPNRVDQQPPILNADEAASGSQQQHPTAASSPPSDSQRVWKEFINSGSSGEEADAEHGGKVADQVVPEIKAEPLTQQEGDSLWPTSPRQSSQGGRDATVGVTESGGDGVVDMDISPPVAASQNMDNYERAPSPSRQADNVDAPIPSNPLADDPIEPFDAPPSHNDPIQQSQQTPFRQATQPVDDPIVNETPTASQTLAREDSMAIDDDHSRQAEPVIAAHDDHPMADPSHGDDHMDTTSVGEAVRNMGVRIIRMPRDEEDPPAQSQSTSAAPEGCHPPQATPTHQVATLATPNIIPPTPLGTQGTLSSSPSLVTGMTVHPPPGLLAPHMSVSGEAPSVEVEEHRNLRPGPVTRSRSGSRSTNNEPPTQQASPAPSRKPKSNGRRKAK